MAGDSSASPATENVVVSRIFAGVHFRFDLTAGTELGHDVADLVVDNLLTRSDAGDDRDDDRDRNRR